VGQLHREEEHGVVGVSARAHTSHARARVCRHVLASNLLLVDEVMRAGMTNLSGRD
jgi:hypothetical protein